MKSKQEFLDKWMRTPGRIGNRIYLDATEVMDALEAQIPTPKFKVGDRVKIGPWGKRGREIHTISSIERVYRMNELSITEMFPENYLSLAPPEPPTMPTVEEFYEVISEINTLGKPLEDLMNRYRAAKEAESA